MKLEEQFDSDDDVIINAVYMDVDDITLGFD